MTIATDPAISSVLDELRTGIASALGDDLVGLFLFGSLVYGDFTEGVSDIDLVAVSRRIVTGIDIDRLREMHRQIVLRQPEWDDRIEVAYQSLHGLRTFRTERTMMGIISPGEPPHRVEAGVEWLMNWYFVLDHGVTLAGPAPETIIPAIPRHEFVDATRAHARVMNQRIREVEDQRGESYAILTTCRALYTHHTGELVSKITAARWVQARHPEWASLIDLALDRRVSPHDNGPVNTFDETVRFVEMVNGEIEGDIDATERHVGNCS